MSANGAESVPRLCHVIKVSTFDGYGFNLHAEQGKPGQYIGKVDDGSPAETAGLKEGDRILEVNGVSIANENHRQVVQKIKSIQNETKLLVITLPANEKVPGLNKTTDKNNKVESKIEKNDSKSEKNETIKVENNEKKEENKSNGAEKHEIIGMKTQQTNKLNLGMTAAEMREQLAAKKKFDPKKVQMDLKHKFEIVKKL